MQVSGADILSAYILVFGKPMDGNKPFADGAAEIRKARKDWRYIFGAVAAAAVTLKAQRGEYADYAEVAALGNELIEDFANGAKA